MTGDGIERPASEPPPRGASMPVAVVALAVLFGTSIWFSINAVAADLATALGATTADIGRLTGAVQLGFIVGTLALSLSGLADRYRASRIVAVSAVLGACFNAATTIDGGGLAGVAALRFAVGLCIAGIYPLGMKLIVSWSPARAGASLSLLIGMLILGTALPHGVRFVGAAWSWQPVVLCSSALALVAAGLMLALGDGPHLPSAGRRPEGGPAARLRVFRIPRFRASALGYFGHMWELY
ncbi:MAG: MFS transporter, partial [Gammaproteobacteria bacterium]|nr:MFS transporter [Gammaproteobacteria bacterium]